MLRTAGQVRGLAGREVRIRVGGARELAGPPRRPEESSCVTRRTEVCVCMCVLSSQSVQDFGAQKEEEKKENDCPMILRGRISSDPSNVVGGERSPPPPPRRDLSLPTRRVFFSSSFDRAGRLRASAVLSPPTKFRAGKSDSCYCRQCCFP